MESWKTIIPSAQKRSQRHDVGNLKKNFIQMYSKDMDQMHSAVY